MAILLHVLMSHFKGLVASTSTTKPGDSFQMVFLGLRKRSRTISWKQSFSATFLCEFDHEFPRIFEITDCMWSCSMSYLQPEYCRHSRFHCGCGGRGILDTMFLLIFKASMGDDVRPWAMMFAHGRDKNVRPWTLKKTFLSRPWANWWSP